MAHEAPTPAEFKARFATVAAGMTDEAIQLFLDEAGNTVDTSWREKDYKNAIMYLAAHLIVSERGADASAGGGGTGSGVVASESFGGMSISYDTAKSATDAAANSQWGGTEYGRRFFYLLKANKPAIVVV